MSTEIKSVKERDNLDLLELVCQLHARALNYPSKEMDAAYLEAREEIESRLPPSALQEGKDEKNENVSLKITFMDCWEFDKLIPAEQRWVANIHRIASVAAPTKEQAFEEIITSLRVLAAYQSDISLPASSTPGHGMKWVKASERLPEKPGIENSVIIRDKENRLVVMGFKNFDEEKPTLYFDTGYKSYLAVEGEGNGNSTWPIKNLQWLDEYASQFTGAGQEGWGKWRKLSEKKPPCPGYYVCKWYYEHTEVVAGVDYMEWEDGGFSSEEELHGFRWLDENN